MTAGAVEEPGSELLLQPGDLMAERRLDDQAPFRGPREVPRLGDREDVAHLLQFHPTIVNHDGWNEKHVLDRSPGDTGR
ncbi:hypothetical protein ACVWXU_008027 [Streptomyces sp. TE33382]